MQIKIHCMQVQLNPFHMKRKKKKEKKKKAQNDMG